MDAPGWRQRGLYAAHAVLLGAPTVFFGGLMALMAVLFGTLALLDAARWGRDAMLLVLWGLGGLTGLIAWLRLSLAFLAGGHERLQRCAWGWWIALACGVAAALPLLWLMVEALGADPAELLHPGSWYVGPALLLPTAHLVWLRLRAR